MQHHLIIQANYDALRDSIQHWERMRDYRERGDEGPYDDDCSLCELWWIVDLESDEDKIENCYGCPIRRKTGWKYCGNSPFSDARDAWRFSLDRKRPFGAMVNFLKGLVGE